MAKYLFDDEVGGTGSKKKTGFSYGSNSYNSNKSYGSYYGWGDWFSSSETLSSEKYIVVKAHDGYITPNRYEIENKYNSLFGKRFGGSIMDVEKVQEISRFLYHRMVDDKDYLKTASQINYGEAYLNSKSEFYKNLWEQEIPGISPLEMALNFFAASNSEKKEGRYISREEMEEACDDGMEDLDSFKKNSQDWWDVELNELFDAKYKNKKLDVLSKISLLRELGAKFEVSKEISERIVANSNKFKKKILRDYSQVHLIDHYQRVMPNYRAKLALKDLTINAPIDIKENKQKIIILLDFSGSMSSSNKQDWVITILADRIKYVLKDQAEIFFSYYVTNPNNLHFYHLHDKESVMSFWKKFSTSPNGGDTDIGSMVKRIKNEIDKGKLCNLNVDLSQERPEILVIHDGQDTVKTAQFEYKTNAITMLDGVNDELKEKCIETEGMYVYIPQGDIGKNNPIVAYEKNIKRELTV